MPQVDGQPEHQLNLSVSALESLIGAEEARRLWRLPTLFRRRSAVQLLPPTSSSSSVASAAASSSSSAAAAAACCPRLPTADGAAAADAPADEGNREGVAAASEGALPHLSSKPEEALRARAAALRAEALALKRGGERDGAASRLAEARSFEEEARRAEEQDEAAAAAGAAGAAAAGAPSGQTGGDCGGGGDGDDEAADAAELHEMFVRRYSIDTRPWNPFHSDAYELTVNVALSDDDAHEGGRLLGVFGGAVQALQRAEGDATVRRSATHAVPSAFSAQIPPL